MSNSSLHREQTVVSNALLRLEVALKMKKPGLAVAFPHKQLNKGAFDDDVTLHIQGKDLREIAPVNGRNRFPTLPVWGRPC